MLSTKTLRQIAIVTVALGLLLLGLSNYHYGLAAQSGILVTIAPLLFAGLLLGRVGVWVTLAFYLPILLLGAAVDFNNAGAGAAGIQDVLADLMQPLLGSIILALILDQLIMKIDAGSRLNRDLIMLCEELEVEIFEREQSQQQLVHSQRVDALGKLASRIAHDFNNLLFILLGYVSRAESAAGDNDDVRHFLRRIDLATHRGQKLTSKLLELARRNDSELELFDVNEVVESLEPLLASFFIRGAACRVGLANRPAPVWMERDGLEATLLNMAKNASDALSDHGEFRLLVGVDEPMVSIRVEDNGQGMTADVLARIFEPFYSTKLRGNGSGIGLALADRVVTQAGGSIEVESEVGKGTRFIIHLPLAEMASVAPAE